jgi:transcriptional regulator with XRE-family HTH domain
MSPKRADPFDASRARIGRTLRKLRESRQWSQAELARRLRVSQPQLSLVERGTASLTAEQFLEILKLFNASATEFAAPIRDSDELDVQNALARHGGRHLRVSGRVVPSEYLAQVHATIIEALATGSPRLLTALAPVLVRNADRINFAKMTSDAHARGLLHRFYWAIENTIAAIEADANAWPNDDVRFQRLASRRLKAAMRFAVGYDSTLEGGDLLDPTIRSDQTALEVEAASSPISKRWHIVTSLQPKDFAEALREAHARD